MAKNNKKEFLTKADILKTSRNIEEFFCADLGKIVRLRRLTDGEYYHSREILMSSITATADVAKVVEKVQENREKGGGSTADILEGVNLQLDVGKLDSTEFEAMVYIAACGLSIGEEIWTEEEVRGMSPPGVVEKIAKKVQEISGVQKGMTELIGSFRQK